jgi:hypothetical protein
MIVKDNTLGLPDWDTLAFIAVGGPWGTYQFADIGDVEPTSLPLYLSHIHFGVPEDWMTDAEPWPWP